MVLLSFVWFPSDNTLLIASDIHRIIQIHTKEGEEGDLLFIVVLYPTRYSTYAVPMYTSAAAKIEEEGILLLISFV